MLKIIYYIDNLSFKLDLKIFFKTLKTILKEENVYIEETACVAGQKESEGPLGKLFDVVVEDAMAGMENWEEAESTLQQLAVDKLLEKWDGKKEDLRYIFAGDLLGQLIATSFGLMQYEIPMFGPVLLLVKRCRLRQ